MTREERIERALREVADILDSFAAMEDEEGRRHAADWTRRIAANARAALAAPPSGTARGEDAAERYEKAILWALGYEVDEHGFRPREPGEGAYWWRKELMERAAIPALSPAPAPRPLAETPREPIPPALLADLRARVVGRELGASPEVCLDVGRAYLASEPAPASRSGDPGATWTAMEPLPPPGICDGCKGPKPPGVSYCWDCHHAILKRYGLTCAAPTCPEHAAPPPASGDARTPERKP
jgi:hypothetical protein